MTDIRQSSTKGLLRREEDEKNSPTACRKTWWRKCVPSDRGICKDRCVRIIIECPENILHLEAGYIYADCLFDSSNLLQSGGGPYIFAN